MTLALSWLRRRILGISPEEVRFVRRGFRGGNGETRQRLERIGTAFLQGYHTALEKSEPEALAVQLNCMEADLRGFAFEGAAMALVLMDRLTLWRRNRWPAFVRGPGAAHLYMVHVGVGWAVARLPWLRGHLKRVLAPLDPLLRWLVVDGYGFHEGYFSWRSAVEAQAVPARLFGYARRAFDHGLGRSLWFVDGADVARIPATIAAFLPSRQADLWSGIGLASAYAGGVGESALQILWESAGTYQPQLGQGAAFAAKARQRAGNLAPHTERACQILCGVSADVAARITDGALQGLPPDGHEPAYEIWRRRIQAHFASGSEKVSGTLPLVNSPDHLHETDVSRHLFGHLRR